MLHKRLSVACRVADFPGFSGTADIDCPGTSAGEAGQEKAPRRCEKGRVRGVKISGVEGKEAGIVKRFLTNDYSLTTICSS